MAQDLQAKNKVINWTGMAKSSTVVTIPVYSGYVKPIIQTALAKPLLLVSFLSLSC